MQVFVKPIKLNNYTTLTASYREYKQCNNMAFT